LFTVRLLEDLTAVRSLFKAKVCPEIRQFLYHTEYAFLVVL
jgi:hypothetical protein